MPLIIPPDHLQMTLVFADTNVTDNEWMVVLGAKLGPLTPRQRCEAVIAAFDSSDLPSSLSESSTFTEIRWVTEEDGGTVTADIQGTSTDPMPPSNCAVLVKKTTNRRGRRAQGRSFWAAVCPEGNVAASGIMTLGQVGTLDDRFTAFFTSGFPEDQEMVVLQNSEGVTPPLSPPPIVNSYDVQLLLGTQRRRMRR